MADDGKVGIVVMATPDQVDFLQSYADRFGISMTEFVLSAAIDVALQRPAGPGDSPYSAGYVPMPAKDQ